jgi:hypothetical protein
MMAKNDLHARRWYAKEEEAATKIQAAYHGYTTRMAYVETICNVITLQSAVRSMIAKNDMRALRQVNRAATKIRAAYMGFITRMNYLITLDSVITCQCAVRAMQARRRLNEARVTKMSNENESATKIQSVFRGYAVRIEYIITVSSIITCQSAVRTLLAKIELKELQQMQWAKEDSAATLIRAAYLGFTARMNYFLTVADIIAIQRYARGHNARTVVNELRAKKRIRQMAVEELEETREKAAIKIQKVFRGFVVYEFAITSLANAIYIRKFLAKIELERRRKLRLLNLSATRIQSSWRSFSAQSNYGLAIYGIISIQSIHRCKLAMAKYQTAQAQRSSAAVTLQCCFRRYLVISRLNRLAEVRAMHGGRIIMNAETTSSAVIQNKWRHFLMQRNMRMRIDLENSSATAIQKCFRGYRDCFQFVVMTFSIIQIQSAARSYRAKLQLEQLKREKDDLDRKHAAAAIVIQSSFRGYREFVRFVLVQYFVIKIQSCARGYTCRQ